MGARNPRRCRRGRARRRKRRPGIRNRRGACADGSVGAARGARIRTALFHRARCRRDRRAHGCHTANRRPRLALCARIPAGSHPVKAPPTPANEITHATTPATRGPSGLRERFEAALRCDPDTRAAWLDTHCTNAVERNTIERMLEADALDAGQTIDRSVEVLLDRIGEDSDPAPPIGARIGPFVLLEKLGEGGSSIVFRAERTQDDVVQQVALKVLRHHLYTHDERRRFRDERRALGQLRHAGIARLIEGGITESGTPYIALEFVQGETLMAHACRHRLDIDGRLRLFVDVCRAVEAAHRALIVHRDLKPSNVLVGIDGDVKLLDFGIAKLLDREDDDDATHTQRRAMTPAYAAPEQLRGGQVTTATDVYALGIML